MEDDKTKIVERLAKEYSEFFKVDTSKQKRDLDGEISTLTTQLEEYKEVLERVHDENKLVSEKIPRLFIHNPTLQKTFQNIDKVEKMVEVIKQDLSELETAVLRAENDLGVGINFSDVLKPLLFKKDPLSFNLSTSMETPTFIKPILKFEPSQHITIPGESQT